MSLREGPSHWADVSLSLSLCHEAPVALYKVERLQQEEVSPAFGVRG